MGTSLLVAAILAWFQSNALPALSTISWFVLLLLINGSRHVLYRNYQHARLPGGGIDLQPWLHYFRMGALAAGCGWGLASLLLFVPGEPIHHLILCFSLAGISAAASTSLAIDRNSALLFIVPAILPLLVRFLVSTEPHHFYISLMLALYLAFLVSTAARSQRLLDIQERIKAQKELEGQQNLGRAIVDSQAAFISEENPNKAFDLLLNRLLALTNSEYGFIGEVLHQPDGTPYLKTYAITNIAWNDETRKFYAEHAPQGMEFFNLNTLFGHVIQHQEVVIANNPGKDPRSGGLPHGHPDLNAFLGIPIKSGNKLIAMVGLANRPAGYNTELIDFLKPMLGTSAQLVEALNLKRRQKEIQATIERLSLVARQTSNGVVITNTAGEIEWANEAFMTICGYDFKEIVGKKPEELLKGDKTSSSDLLIMRNALAGMQPFQMEMINYRKDGTPYWIDINCSPLHDQDGAHQGFILIETDITERKDYEQKITETSKLLAGVLDASSEVAIISTDTQGIVKVFNQGAEKMLGYKADDLIDKQTPALWHIKSEVEKRGQELTRQLGHKVEGFRVFVEIPEQEGSEQGEWTIVTRDGNYKSVHLVVTAIRSDNNDISGYLGVLHDITEQKKSQEEIRQFKNTLDQTLDCVFMFDASTLKFYYVNQGAIKQVGYTESELMEMHPYDIKPEFTRDEFRNFIRPMISGEYASETFETLQQHKDGHNIPAEVFLQYIAPKGERARFVAIVRDITERKRVEKLKNEFVSTVSHELRTPLTSICGSLGLIAGTSMNELSEQNRQLVSIANSNSQRLSKLINDLLDMEKITAGKMEFRLQPEALMPQIEQAVASNQGYAEKHDVRFKIVNRLDEIKINIDSQRLQQILSNLLSNAAKFSTPGESIEIDTQLTSDRVRISIIDHGQGIPGAFQARLFEKFSQADSSDSRQKGGTGLGLAISKEFTERMHGHIGFDSEEGKGSTFWIEFPVLF